MSGGERDPPRGSRGHHRAAGSSAQRWEMTLSIKYWKASWSVSRLTHAQRVRAILGLTVPFKTTGSFSREAGSKEFVKE